MDIETENFDPWMAKEIFLLLEYVWLLKNRTLIGICSASKCYIFHLTNWGSLHFPSNPFGLRINHLQYFETFLNGIHRPNLKYFIYWKTPGENIFANHYVACDFFNDGIFLLILWYSNSCFPWCCLFEGLEVLGMYLLVQLIIKLPDGRVQTTHLCNRPFLELMIGTQ